MPSPAGVWTRAGALLRHTHHCPLLLTYGTAYVSECHANVTTCPPCATAASLDEYGRPYKRAHHADAYAVTPRQPLPPARVPQLLGRGVTRLKDIVKTLRKVGAGRGAGGGEEGEGVVGAGWLVIWWRSIGGQSLYASHRRPVTWCLGPNTCNF